MVHSVAHTAKLHMQQNLRPKEGFTGCAAARHCCTRLQPTHLLPGKKDRQKADKTQSRRRRQCPMPEQTHPQAQRRVQLQPVSALTSSGVPVLCSLLSLLYPPQYCSYPDTAQTCCRSWSPCMQPETCLWGGSPASHRIWHRMLRQDAQETHRQPNNIMAEETTGTDTQSCVQSQHAWWHAQPEYLQNPPPKSRHDNNKQSTKA